MRASQLWSELLHRLQQRVQALRRLGRRTAPEAPAWGLTRLWYRSTLIGSPNYRLVLAVVVGILTGLGSVGFIRLLQAITAFARGPLAEGTLGRFVGPAQLVLLPALGGLLAGPLIERFAREARGHGVPEVMTALSTRGGRIRTRVAVVKILASAFTIGFGGMAGREGPMVQIGAGIGSILAQFTRLTARNIRMLVACGAAGGIAATFNAPIAGAIFSMEVLMGRVHMDFLLVLLTSLSSCLVARSFLGDHPAFLAPAYSSVGASELPLYFGLGLLVGLAAIAYVRLLYYSEDVFGAWRSPEWLKPAFGGLIVGLMLRYFPEAYGTGLATIESALWVRLPWELLLALFVAELIGNCATLGSGGSGGVFAPSLFMGAMLGGSYGHLVHLLFPDATAGSGAYAMVGMAAFFAAAAKAPMTSILILFEMTNDYRIILPLMTATVAGVYISHAYLPHSIYMLKLQRRGIGFPQFDEPTLVPGAPRPAPERSEAG